MTTFLAFVYLLTLLCQKQHATSNRRHRPKRRNGVVPLHEPPTRTGANQAVWEGPKIGLCHSVVTRWREIVYHVDQDSANISWPTFASLVVPYAFAALLLIVDARLRMAWWHPHPTPVHLSSSTVLLGEVESPCEGA
ncbi:hypothetical protein CMEL01_09186 [Colletotrichum melonis]|uniref:Uncharacterized protein n=1 Tax=Colletotrichum melonis TaxID=1209925 RepID=A0AAI9TWL7_9PEZI|nr:hypothetical protein CMEL01_09186 [Colletotrichum melonis]